VIPSETRHIGGHTYEISRLPFGQWRTLQEAVWPVIGPMLPLMAEKPETWTAEKVVRASSLILPMHEGLQGKAIPILGSVTRVEGQKGTLDRFAEVWWAEQGYEYFAQWLVAALEVQLVPFLTGLPLAELGALASPDPATSPFPTGSTG